MARVLALLRDAPDQCEPPRRPCAGEGWRDVLVLSGATVLCKDLAFEVEASAEPRWAIVGDLFDEEGAPCGAPEFRGDVDAWLGALTASRWGRYVAFARDRSGAWRLMRDPSGRLGCFVSARDDERIVFSHLEDAFAFGWRSAGVDWNFVALLLQDGRVRDGRTALIGIEEALPGERIGPGMSRFAIWSPRTFAEGEPIEQHSTARELLRASVERSVRAFALGAKRIVHQLSGGLDSSVVLACLAAAGAGERVLCLHFTRGRGSELDEAEYARAAASAAACPLRETLLDPSSVDLARASEVTTWPRPLGYAYSIENDDLEHDAAVDWGADACFSAAGGDGLFYQLKARLYAADYLLRHGVGAGALRVALDNARLSRISFWNSLLAGCAFAYGGRRFDPTASSRNPYLGEAAREIEAGWLWRHPWFAGAERLAPGKALHLWAVLDCLNLFYPYRRAAIADTVFPLISQPVIETVLAIPSYVLSSGGRDRTLLREAFADLVPVSILDRRSKGAMDGYYAELCAANLNYVRERLSEGVLAGRGLLDRTALERDLPGTGEPAYGREMLVLRMFATEVWASAWCADRGEV